MKEQTAKKIERLVLCSCLILAYNSSVLATNGMRVIGFGPVQRTMGGANTALPLDSAVTLSNPAALIELDRRADIAATYFNPKVRYKAASNAAMITRNNVFIDSDTGPCVMPAAGVTLPVNDRFTFGFGAYGVCGMGVDYPSNLYHNVTYTEYQLMKFAPAIAHRINNNLSIGAALNLNYATMEFHAGSPIEQPHKDGEVLGVGVTVGTMYKVSENVALGLAYESKQSFSDFRFNTPGGTDKLRLNQPQSLTCGLGIKPTDRFRMAFDVSWIDWPQTVGKNLPSYTQNRSGATAWNMNWDEQFVYKLGCEYDVDNKTKLRLGYNYARNPLDSSRAFENIAFPAITEHHITGGLGINLTDKLILNLGAMYAPKVSFETANSNQFINSATTEMSQYSIEVGIAKLF
jgi:long-chain fatty acid transport protein